MAKKIKNGPKVLLAGGGSGGPVAPLLAVAEQIEILKPSANIILIGTKKGPEQHMAFAAGLNFYPIQSARLRRYWSWGNLLAPFRILIGFFQAILIIRKFRPDIAMGAGGFVQVPALWAARICGVPVLIHQQDVLQSLANKLCMPIAKKITVTFVQSQKDFYSSFGFLKPADEQKIMHTGNPVREFIGKANETEARAFFGLHSDLPVLFVIGGGTGAGSINRLVTEELSELAKLVQIIHVTGRGKHQAFKHDNYHAYEFLDRVDFALAAADLVISRAGLNLITELSATGKVSIIIPIPDSHQEYNGSLLESKKAAIVLDQRDLNPELLRKILRHIIFDVEAQAELSKNIGKLMPHDAASKIAKILLESIN